MKVVCATGHRLSGFSWYNKNGNTLYNENNPECIKIKSLLMQELEKLVLAGYDYFISGMALGFDIWFAEAVLELKKKYPHIKLEAAIPCYGQENVYIDQYDKDRYNYVRQQVDKETIVCKDNYKPYYMIKRNHYMVDKSNLVLSCYGGTAGGTRECFIYAINEGVNILNINPNNYSIEFIENEREDDDEWD